MSKIWRVVHQPYLHFVSSAGDVVSADEMAMYVTWLEKAKRSTDDIVSSQPFPLNTAVWEPVPNTGLEIKVVPSAKGIVVYARRCDDSNKETTQNLVRKLHELADRWERMALAQVPPEYANRRLHDKYLRLDNEAAGLQNCAEELREFISNAESGGTK